MNEEKTEYGLRDDVAIAVYLLPPTSSLHVAVKGRLRDVIQVINKLGWNILRAEVDIDEFLAFYHSCKESVKT